MTELIQRVESPLTPARIVEELNAYVVGQDDARRAIAIAFRNRMRRSALPPEFRRAMHKPNILLSGPIGIGKSELVQRLAELSAAPVASMLATSLPMPGREGPTLEASIRDLSLSTLPENACDEDRSAFAQSAMVIIEELDKIVAPATAEDPTDSELLQRSLLPVLRGTSIATDRGAIDTSDILFIASGNFGRARPTDMVPELQVQFPIRIELAPLEEDDLLRILTAPTNSLPARYAAMLATDSAQVTFAEDGLREIAAIAWDANQRSLDIGARRLGLVLDSVLESLLFSAPDGVEQPITIDAAYVNDHAGEMMDDEDLSTYIL